MTLVAEYRDARREEDLARLRRLLVLRAMVASGLSQRQIAEALGVSQPAVSQQLQSGNRLDGVHPQVLLEAAGPVLKALAADFGFERLAVFGSIARGTASAHSDIDLMVESPPGTSSLEFVGLKRLIEQVLGREVDLIDYGGLKPKVDDDIPHEAVLL